MRLLDLFCGAGGAAMGYHRAGFDEIVGVDIKPQPRYPFTFVQGDALEYCSAHGREFDAIHASPPCQAYSEATPMEARKHHPKLIAATRQVLAAIGKPFVIENVENARADMRLTMMLCGTMFGLNLWRHRYFEIEPFRLFMSPASCNHAKFPVVVSGKSRKARVGIADRRTAMNIEWMSNAEITEAIPPAYTEYIGRQLLAYLSDGGRVEVEADGA